MNAATTALTSIGDPVTSLSTAVAGLDSIFEIGSYLRPIKID